MAGPHRPHAAQRGDRGVKGRGQAEKCWGQRPGPARPARSLPSWACVAHSCTMGRLLGVGERKERSEGRGTGLPWDEAAGPIPPATKLPKKASPAERRGPSGSQQAPAAQPTAPNSPPPPHPTPAPWTLAPAWVNSARLRAAERDPRCLQSTQHSWQKGTIFPRPQGVWFSSSAAESWGSAAGRGAPPEDTE